MGALGSGRRWEARERAGHALGTRSARASSWAGGADGGGWELFFGTWCAFQSSRVKSFPLRGGFTVCSYFAFQSPTTAISGSGRGVFSDSCNAGLLTAGDTGSAPCPATLSPLPPHVLARASWGFRRVAPRLSGHA